MTSPNNMSSDWTGEAIIFFNVYLARRSPRTVSNLFDLIWNVPVKKCPAAVREFLGRKESDLRCFLYAQEQYFEVTGDSVTLRPKKTKEEIESVLKSAVQQLTSDSSSEDSSVPARTQGSGATQKKNIRIIVDPGECADIVRQIMNQPSPVVALDCEGHNLGKYGKLHLVQLATYDGCVYLFDVLATDSKTRMFVQGKLADLLESDQVVKVMHNCRGDSVVLHNELGVSLKNVFDTECAYTTLLSQHNIVKRESGPGLNHICELFGGPTNEIKESKSFRKRMIYTPNFWSRRPLTTEMVNYAAKDVTALVPTVYENMNKLISDGWRSLMKKHCEDNVTCHFNWKRDND